MLGRLSSASILGPSFTLYLMVRSFSWQTPSERQMPGGFFFLPTLWRQNRSPRCGSRPASSENDGEAGVSIHQNTKAQAWLLYSVVSPEPSWSGRPHSGLQTENAGRDLVRAGRTRPLTPRGHETGAEGAVRWTVCSRRT